MAVTALLLLISAPLNVFIGPGHPAFQAGQHPDQYRGWGRQYAQGEDLPIFGESFFIA